MLLFITGAAVVKMWASIFIQDHSKTDLTRFIISPGGGKTVETATPGIAGAVKASPSLSTGISERTSNLRGKQKKSSVRFGLAVAHCEEDYLASWIDEVDGVTLLDGNGRPTSTSWNVTVYERCDQRVSSKYSKSQRNVGSEECTAYLRYIIDRYDDLPEIIYFLQPDALRLNPRGHQHTNFSSFQELVAASAPLMLSDSYLSSERSGFSSGSQVGFLNLGNDTIDETRLIQREGPNSNPVEIIDMMKNGAPLYEEDTMLELVTGACFAVRRERILEQPSEFYKDLMLAVMTHEDPMWTCFSLEATWHVVFGEPLAIPKEATLMHHLEEKAMPL